LAGLPPPAAKTLEFNFLGPEQSDEGERGYQVNE